jgi:hypothetical protein
MKCILTEEEAVNFDLPRGEGYSIELYKEYFLVIMGNPDVETTKIVGEIKNGLGRFVRCVIYDDLAKLD